VELGQQRGMTLDQVNEALDRSGARKSLNVASDAAFESIAANALRRDELDRAVAAYPTTNAQGRFMRNLAGSIATPSGQSHAEIASESAFAYVNFSPGGGAVQRAWSGRERSVPAQVLFSVSRKGGRWRISVFHRNGSDGRPDADYVRFFKNWLVSGGIPAKDLE
jgi:hypothetical protein